MGVCGGLWGSIGGFVWVYEGFIEGLLMVFEGFMGVKGGF